MDPPSHKSPVVVAPIGLALLLVSTFTALGRISRQPSTRGQTEALFFADLKLSSRHSWTSSTALSGCEQYSGTRASTARACCYTERSAILSVKGIYETILEALAPPGVQPQDALLDLGPAPLPTQSKTKLGIEENGVRED